eukprot:8869704-Ditylum_brightwellii.AAC.1
MFLTMLIHRASNSINCCIKNACLTAHGVYISLQVKGKESEGITGIQRLTRVHGYVVKVKDAVSDDITTEGQHLCNV